MWCKHYKNCATNSVIIAYKVIFELNLRLLKRLNCAFDERHQRNSSVAIARSALVEIENERDALQHPVAVVL